jgi:hypothetical protein
LSASCEAYSIASNRWTLLEQHTLPYAIYGMSMIVLHSVVFVFGGADRWGIGVSDVYVL